jgi:hypothetical protein
MTQKPGIGAGIAAIVGGYAVGAAVALPFTNAPVDDLAATTEPAA